MGGSARELVPETVDGQDELGVAGVALQLLAQRRDMDVDGSRDRRGVVTPHVVQELVSRQELAPVRDEILKELELERGERDRLAFPRHLRAAEVDLDVAEGVGSLSRRDRGA